MHIVQYDCAQMACIDFKEDRFMDGLTSQLEYLVLKIKIWWGLTTTQVLSNLQVIPKLN